MAVGASEMLLRVSARLPADGPNPDRRPALIADHGSDPERFEALPSPPDPPGVLRAAYAVAAALVTPQTRFWLDLGDGASVALPAPTPGAPRRATEPPTELAEVSARAERLAAENKQLSVTLEELEIWRGELERRLADTTTELAETRARLAEAQAAAQREALLARAETDALEQAAWELMQASSGA